MAWNLIFQPGDGAFDVAAIRDYLDGQPDIVADPHGTDYYMVSGRPDLVQTRWEGRMEDPSRFPRGGLIRVSPAQVTLLQESANYLELRSELQFAKWLCDHFKPRVLDNYGNDITEQCRNQGIESQYLDEVRNLASPWADKLIKVGFFRELDHGDVGGPSLEESRAEAPGPDEDRTVAYLESGHRLNFSSEVANDWLADDPDVEIGPPHILTDGTYAWPADLSYYVRNYHVRLPKHFVKHIKRNDFQVPANVDVASLTLE
jgi:hypothetical protein